MKLVRHGFPSSLRVNPSSRNTIILIFLYINIIYIYKGKEREREGGILSVVEEVVVQ